MFALELKMEEILNPNCSEYVCRIGIKTFEIPYIKKRLKDLGYSDDELLDEFTDYINKSDDVGFGGFMDEGYADDYEKIKSELLAKRENKSCPFCKEPTKDLRLHIKEYHKEEVISMQNELTEEDINTMRKEVILDNLE